MKLTNSMRLICSSGRVEIYGGGWTLTNWPVRGGGNPH